MKLAPRPIVPAATTTTTTTTTAAVTVAVSMGRTALWRGAARVCVRSRACRLYKSMGLFFSKRLEIYNNNNNNKKCIPYVLSDSQVHTR